MNTTAELAIWGGTPERRRYLLQNWRADVTTLLNTLGEPVEWYRYSAYGTPTAHPIADVNGDGAVDSADVTVWNAIEGGDSSGAVWDMPDLNRDDIFPDQSDEDFFLAQHATASAAVTAGGTSGYQSQGVYNLRKGYAGYEWDRTLTMWHVRHRVLDSGSGKWTRRDPLGFVDGMNDAAYVRSVPIKHVDPYGTEICNPSTNREDLMVCGSKTIDGREVWRCTLLKPGECGDDRYDWDWDFYFWPGKGWFKCRDYSTCDPTPTNLEGTPFNPATMGNPIRSSVVVRGFCEQTCKSHAGNSRDQCAAWGLCMADCFQSDVPTKGGGMAPDFGPCPFTPTGRDIRASRRAVFNEI